MGVSNRIEDKENLVGHLTIELLQLLNNFYTTSGDKNTLKAEVVGRSKREIDLVVPRKFCATTKSQRFAQEKKKKVTRKKKNLLTNESYKGV